MLYDEEEAELYVLFAHAQYVKSEMEAMKRFRIIYVEDNVVRKIYGLDDVKDGKAYRIK